MSKLPNPEKAIVDLAKLRDYCLNPEHPVGKHKARVFVSTLGLTQEDAAYLQLVLLEAAQTGDTEPEEEDQYGQRYVLDLELTTEVGQATIRSAWMVRSGEDFPRLITYPNC